LAADERVVLRGARIVAAQSVMPNSNRCNIFDGTSRALATYSLDALCFIRKSPVEDGDSLPQAVEARLNEVGINGDALLRVKADLDSRARGASVTWSLRKAACSC
jgi:hypothetical protein